MTLRKLVVALAMASMCSVFAVSPSAVAPAALAAPNAGVAPNSTYNNLDCNGFSAAYKTVRPDMRMDCTDPILKDRAGMHGEYQQAHRAYDNGHYIGHDEPSLKFESGAAGSANNITWYTQLPSDPAGTPTTSPSSSPTTSDEAELTPAIWFGLPLCDSNSWPTAAGADGGSNPCTPDSDTNAPGKRFPDGAGSAFMELQFYPPGYGPYVDAISCDATHYCAALNIDSLEKVCDASGCDPNSNCFEPINLAFLTKDGIPTGPPSPQKATLATASPNGETLMMSPGDSLRVQLIDTASGLLTKVDDLTSHESGFMVASGANGFMNTNPSTCAGTPYDFHAEYSTASAGNIVPWAALEGGVLASSEQGHFEPCTSISNNLPVSENLHGQQVSDTHVDETCSGPFEAQDGGSTTGEDCVTSSSAVCGKTVNQQGCSTGTTCELTDAYCFPSGSRTVSMNGVNQTWTWPINGCTETAQQNGDLDYDGSSYIADWPDGGATHPTSLQLVGPFDGTGSSYPRMQFESDLPGSEDGCGTSGACSIPPSGASFYPFYSLQNTTEIPGTTAPAGTCVWNFGNDTPGKVSDFSKDAQYGSASASYFGNFISAQQNNPAINGSCPAYSASTVAPAPPTVSSVSPRSGYWESANTLTVTGTNLLTTQSVQLGPASPFGICAGPSSTSCFVTNSNTQLTVRIPAQAAGTYHLLVDTTGGANVPATADQYTYVAFHQLYEMDSLGGLHSIPLSPGPDVAPLLNQRLARGVVMLSTTSGYVLDGWGGLHPFGGAPSASGTGWWPGWDIARGIVLLPSGTGGYVLDGWGGMHPFEIGGHALPPRITVGPYWSGWDIARGVAIDSTGTGGYILDGWGGVHPYGTSAGTAPAQTRIGPYWKGWDIARGIVLRSNNTTGYVLDGWGGVHPFGPGGSTATPAVPFFISGYWAGWDIARSIVLQPGTDDQGWTLDGWGGIHEWNNAPHESTTYYTPGQDVNRALADR